MKNVFFVFLAFSLASCFSDHDHAQHESQNNETQEKQEARISLSKELETEVLKIYGANFEIHQAFISENLAQVQEAAKKLNSIYYSFKADYPTFSELQKIESSLEQMQNKDDLDDLAISFGEINQVMVDYLLKYNLSATYNVYYCPMVDKRWLQDSAKVAEVQNPYAIYMLKCGTRETTFNL